MEFRGIREGPGIGMMMGLETMMNEVIDMVRVKEHGV